MLHVDRGRTDSLLSPIRIIVRMPEPDCFLRYRIYRVAQKKRPEHLHGVMQQSSGNESAEKNVCK